MPNLSTAGRIIFGAAIVEIGLQTMYVHDFPYMLLPPNHTSVPGLVVLTYVFGALFALAGACIVLGKKTRPAAGLLGLLLLLVFLCYHIPYEFLATNNYMHFGEWENAAKELAFAGGAWVIAGAYPQKDENAFTGFLGKLIPYGAIIFSITILSFGIDHYLGGKDAAGYVPSWIPWHLFWIYFTGTALIVSSLAIMLNIKRALAATLLGAMILAWFVLVHIPRVIVSPPADLPGEITSAIMALAYGGIAWVIAGVTYRRNSAL
jgi:uncharacterized membrane protein YphA (DoxX/SURF4 family)